MTSIRNCQPCNSPVTIQPPGAVFHRRFQNPPSAAPATQETGIAARVPRPWGMQEVRARLAQPGFRSSAFLPFECSP